MHEASLYTDNSFVTLTYDTDNLPSDWSLNKKHFQRFMKELRRDRERKGIKQKVRFFHCGEYGELLRPHYHAILFGVDFSDKVKFNNNSGNPLYISSTLQRLWPYGLSSIGDVTFESAAYVARYVVKKQTGKNIEQSEKLFGLSPYNRCDMVTGELYNVEPEYATMSRGGNVKGKDNLGGIGKRWYEKYKDDAYPSDFLIVNGKKCLPPKYYDVQYALENEEEWQKIRSKRVHGAYQRREHSTPERLRIKETIKHAQLSMLKRTIE